MRGLGSRGRELLLLPSQTRTHFARRGGQSITHTRVRAHNQSHLQIINLPSGVPKLLADALFAWGTLPRPAGGGALGDHDSQPLEIPPVP
eukprot:2307846-Prymnesium_polylepis.1